MKTSAVNRSSFLEYGGRIDASFHLSEGVSIKRTIYHSPYPLSTVGAVSKDIFYGNRAKRVYVSKIDKGIPFLSSSDILSSDLDNVKYASKKYTPGIAQLRLEEGWILVSRSGTIGNTAWTNKRHAQKLASEHVIRIIPNDILRGGFLYAYLSSRQGHSLLTQGTFGGVIQHIEPDFVRSIPIPIFPDAFQIKVDSLIKESARLREVSIEALYASHKIVESYFPAVPSKKNCQSVSIKDIWSSQAHRMESSYHIADGKFYDAFIRDNFLWKPLGDMSKSISRPDIFKRMYVDNGITFLGGTDIMLSIPDSKKKLSKKAHHIDDFMVDEGWILLPRSGTIGDVVYTTSQHAQKLVSEHVIRIIPNDILSGGYVFAFLSSKIGRALIQRPIFGSVIQHVEPPLLKTMPIPIIEDEKMEEISNLAETYRSAWGEACKKELEAIALVEAEIEKWNK